jgi:hypothetical protein
MYMSRRKIAKVVAKNNGEATSTPLPTSPVSAVADNGQSAYESPEAAELLQAAVNNPGRCIIEEEPSDSDQPEPVLEIPEETDDDTDIGEPLTTDPALLTVKISKPSPNCFVRFHPDRIHSVKLLAYKPRHNSSPEYHYVVPSLRAAFDKRDLKPVRAFLLTECDSGEAFLWLVPESEMSPYHNAVQRILAQGAEKIAQCAFLIGMADRDNKNKEVPVRLRLSTAEDKLPRLPSRELKVLLAEALGPDRIINSTAHPVYQSLTAGKVL